MSNTTATLPPVIPESLQELKAECSKQLLEALPLPLGEASHEQVTQTLLEILCRMDALEDRYDCKTLNILHFNDCYNLKPKLEQPPHHAEAYGGFARFSTVFNQEKAKYENDNNSPMILFSGDFVGPSLTSSISQGAHVLHAMNELGIHYATFGNHEFDFGLQKLMDILAGKVDPGEPDHGPSVTTWIASNMNGADGNPLAGAKKKVIVDWNGIKVGLLGCSENWLSCCGKLEEGEAIYLDHIAETNRLCAAMREEGVEIILALTHSRLANDKEFAKLCPGVDLVLGGHDHFSYLDLDERLVKGGEEWKYLNSIQIKLKNGAHGAKPKVTCRQIPIFYDVEPDPKAQEIEQLYTDFIASRMDKVIGTTPIELESTEEFLRFEESELGNFIADVMKEHFKCDIGIIQGFEIAGKYVLKAGDIRLRDVYSWFPAATTCISVKLTGAEIVEAFEVGVRSLPGECGGFVHVSKLVRYTGMSSQV